MPEKQKMLYLLRGGYIFSLIIFLGIILGKIKTEALVESVLISGIITFGLLIVTEGLFRPDWKNEKQKSN